MKSKEYHKKLVEFGWVCIRSKGSHRIYEKDGMKISVPFHSSDEISKGLYEKLRKIVGF